MDYDIDDGAGPSRIVNSIEQTSQINKSLWLDNPLKSSNRKRRLSSPDNEPSGKIFVCSSDSTTSKLLTLSDEVLLEILKYCSSVTLDALSR